MHDLSGDYVVYIHLGVSFSMHYVFIRDFKDSKISTHVSYLLLLGVISQLGGNSEGTNAAEKCNLMVKAAIIFECFK